MTDQDGLKLILVIMIIGSNSTILPVKISSNIVIGAGWVVTKDLEMPGTYAGNPKIDKKI